MPADESPFWAGPPNPMDHIPDDLSEGDEGDVVVPVIPWRWLGRLEEAAWSFDRLPDMRKHLDGAMDSVLAGCEALSARAEMLVARGDPDRVHRLAVAAGELSAMLHVVEAWQTHLNRGDPDPE